MVRKIIVTCAAILAFVDASGCSGPAHEYDSAVTGTVTIDGDLAKSGTIAFHPVKKEGRAAIGRIHPDGSYSLRTGQGDLTEVDGGTVMPGEYLVTVAINSPPAEGVVVGTGGPPLPGPRLIHSKYLNKDTTDLRRTVKPGSNVFVFELESAEPEPETVDAPDDTEPVSDAPDAADSSVEPTEGKSVDSQSQDAASNTAPSDSAPPSDNSAEKSPQ